MLFDVGGAAPPAEWLQDLPLVDSWVVPGLVLFIGFGLGSLATSFGMLTKTRWPGTGWIERMTGRHWSWAAAIGLGLGLMAWLGLQLIYLPEAAWLQAIYGAVGLALMSMPWLSSVREHLKAEPVPRTTPFKNAKISPDPI
jgi:hypothetical protein